MHIAIPPSTQNEVMLDLAPELITGLGVDIFAQDMIVDVKPPRSVVDGNKNAKTVKFSSEMLDRSILLCEGKDKVD